MDHGRVHGLIVFPIPTPEGELTRFVRTYAHVLGDSGGERLLWRPIGDPRQVDDIYRRQQTPTMAQVDNASAAQFKREVAKAASQDHYIAGQNLLAGKRYGIRQSDLPVILFLACEPVNAHAVMHVDDRMLKSERCRRALADLLADEVSEQSVWRFADDGAFTRASVKRLQQHLVSVERKICHAANQSESLTRSASAGRRYRAASGNAKTSSASAYAVVTGSDRHQSRLSKKQYEALVRERKKYDFLIDGLAHKCFKRTSPAKPHSEAKLTVSEFALLRAYILSGRRHRPIEFRWNDASPDEMSAIRLFNAARRKADIREGSGSFTLFRTHQGRSANLRTFEFDPPSTVRWLLIAEPEA